MLRQPRRPLLLLLLLLPPVLLLLPLAPVSAAPPQLRVSRLGGGAITSLPGLADIPEERAGGAGAAVTVRLDAADGGYALEFYTEEHGDAAPILTVPEHVLRAAEVARTADHAFTLLLLAVAPGPARLVISYDAALPYADAYAALFATGPPRLGLMKKIEAAIADLKGINTGDDFSPWIFSCHDDTELEKHTTDTKNAQLDLVRDPPVAEMKQDGIFGLHHFIRVSPPPLFTNGGSDTHDPTLADRFNGACFRAPGTEESERAGCGAFESRVGSSVRAVRQCMIDALAPSVPDLVEHEWSHADPASNTLPERESGTGKGPFSSLRGAWPSKKEFADALPRFIVLRMLQKLSWMSWNGAWSHPDAASRQETAPAAAATTRKAELDAWTGVRPGKWNVLYQISRATGLRGAKKNSAGKKTYPFQRFQDTIPGDVRAAMAQCVIEGGGHPLRLKYQLRCLPVLYDTPGVVTNGMSDDIGSYAGTKNHVKHACPGVAPSCARAAVEMMIKKFATHSFSILASMGMTGSGRPSWASCLSVESANCRFFSGCTAKATRRVCGALRACCPDEQAHAACARDPGSKACKAQVCPEDGPFAVAAGALSFLQFTLDAPDAPDIPASVDPASGIGGGDGRHARWGGTDAGVSKCRGQAARRPDVWDT